jgi:hypothetical protein
VSETSAPLETRLLAGVPKTLRDELLRAYAQIVRNFRERRWEPAELNGGKLCEVVYTILRGYVDGAFPANSSKPGNMVDACRALEQAPATFPRSVRIQIPRMLVVLYEIRNNRGVGHVGGDVDPNHMDAVCVLEMSKWVMSELARVFHNVSTEEATTAVDALVDRTLPMVWKAGQNLRVLDPNLSMKGKALLLLYHSQGVTAENDLCRWVEHSNPSVFRRDVIRKAHREKLVEYDPEQGTVEISPRGVEYVERLLLK